MMVFHKKHRWIAPVIAAAFLLLASCEHDGGELIFRANGEEFIRDGFVSKEGWHLAFDQVLVNIASPAAYNEQSGLEDVVLPGTRLVDLAGGTAADPSVAAGSVENVRAGNYQSLRFSLKRLNEGPYAGYSLILKGTARKEERSIPFVIKLDEELTFDGKEGYVGDSVKGLLKKGEAAEVEMTFHFDHIFGDAAAPGEDHVNAGSPGFALFARYEENGAIDVDQGRLKDDPGYAKLISSFDSLGHLGEGHCDVIR